ncbi:hypothetical protein LJC17_02475 [Acholeplasma sp. OttesenSCG-928-E16]|nr:hypothetical protein [Acholeplasma sp. OttesenSCG-928-E16]
MNKFVVINTHYNSLLEELIELQYYDIADDLIAETLSYYAKYQDLKETIKVVGKLNKIKKETKDFVTAKGYYYQNRSDKAIKIMKNIFHLKREYSVFYLRMLDQYQEGNEILKIIANFDHQLDFGTSLFIEFLKIKHQNSNQLISFIKTNFYDNCILISEYELLIYFLEEGKKIFKNIYYYKDALNLETKIIARIKLLLFA